MAKITTEEKVSKRAEIRKIITSIPRAFALVWQAGPLLTAGLFLTTLFSSLFPVAGLWMTKLVIDRITEMSMAATGGATVSVRPLWYLIMGLGGIWVLNRIVDATNAALTELLQYRLHMHAQTLIMRKCADLDAAFFEDSRNFDMLENARRGASSSAWQLLWSLFGMLRGCLTLVTFAVALMHLHWIVMIIVVIAVLPDLFIAPLFARQRWRMIKDRADDSRLHWYLGQLLMDRSAVKELRSYGIADYLIGRYQYYWQKFFKQESQLAIRRHGTGLAMSLTGTVVTTGVWCYVGLRAVVGTITIGDVVFYTQAVSNCQGSLSSMIHGGAQLYENTLFLGNLFALLDLDPREVEGALRGPEGSRLRWGERAAPTCISRGIEFRNVSFKYPGTDRLIIQNFSCTLRPHETVALVGKNGAGKTTLIKLLLRLYDPTEGEILLDGYNYRDYDLAGLRRLLGVAFQDYVNYNLTLREGIGLGAVAHVDNMPKVEQAAKRVGVNEIAERLPNKYETYLGRQFTGLSTDLSGGEWQKLALSRAYIRDSGVLILDEPTASLDTFAEHEVYNSFAEMTKDRIVVLISHRFSTVRMADNILVLDEGGLAEQGRHEVLMANKALYASMFTMQAERYG